MSAYDIEYNSHYFIPMYRNRAYSPNAVDTIALVECIILSGMYGKILAVPCGYENGNCFYKSQSYYESDFYSNLCDGIIIKKESKTQHVEIIDEWEPLTNNTYIVHRVYAVVD